MSLKRCAYRVVPDACYRRRMMGARQILVPAALAGVLGAVAAAHADPGAVAERYFDADFLDRARDYRDVRYTLFFLRAAVVLAVCWWLAVRPPRPLRRLAAVGGWRGRLGVLLGALVLLALVRLPFGLFGFAHARAYGLRTDGWGDYLLDVAKAYPLGWVVAAAVALPVLALFARYPGRWPVPAMAIVSVLTGVYAFLSPLVVDPLFNRIRPLPDTPLRADVVALCRRGGAPVDEVWVADASRRTHAVNAYFTGFGPSRRIVLYDTLLDTLDAEGVLRVVAHEVGHWKHRHVMRGILLGLVAAAVGFVLLERALSAWVRRRLDGDRGSPLLVLPAYALYVTASLATLPAVNAVSRMYEREADRTALELTADPEGFIDNRVTIAHKNLSDVNPARWIEVVLYTHPSTARRIEVAEALR